MKAWLVYEVNNLSYEDVPYVSTFDMVVFNTKEEALREMQDRKEMYIKEKEEFNWKLVSEEADNILFEDTLGRGEFEIRLLRIA